jgi:hypothetical protein
MNANVLILMPASPPPAMAAPSVELKALGRPDDFGFLQPTASRSIKAAENKGPDC